MPSRKNSTLPLRQPDPNASVGEYIEALTDSLSLSNLRSMGRFLLVLAVLVIAYAAVFKLLMAHEGRDFSWFTSVYWTLTTMSTLGYGDIVFSSDIGRMFSMIVLLSGMIFMLVILPFAFIELFYEPWLRMRARHSLPRTVDEELEGHVLLTFFGAIANALIQKLTQFNYPYVVVLDDEEAVRQLTERGIRAMYGELNDPETYKSARFEHAALLASTRSDIENTTVVFTARGVADNVPILATAREAASKDVLKLAGCTRVLDITALVAEGMARRVLGKKKLSHIVGRIDDLVIAEVEASRTTLVGEPYLIAQQKTRASIVGFWLRGNFEIGSEDSIIEDSAVLLLAGSVDQIRSFDREYEDQTTRDINHSVVIVGGGRVGRATAEALDRRGIPSYIIEQLPERILDERRYIGGSASDSAVLEKARFSSASTVVITPRDDDTNVYLTILYRLLNPKIQIISRASYERSVQPLHRAGADAVISQASVGSSTLFNLLQRSDLLMVAEGLDVFKVEVPKSLIGKTIAEADIRNRTGCTVIGIDQQDRATRTDPDKDSVLPAEGEIVLIGTPEGEEKFLKTYGMANQ